MRISFMNIPILLVISALLVGCHSVQQKSENHHNLAKIKFDLNGINADGLRGPPDGLVSVAYEFCIPANDQVYQEVRKIDSSVQIQPGAPGRIACSKDQALSIGQTNQPHWLDVLKTLSSQTYIAEIQECFYE